MQQYAQDNMLMTCFGAYTPATITEQMKERKQGRNLQSRTVFLQELKKSDSENASALEAKFGNPVQVQELEKWLTSIGVGFPAKNALLNEKMSDIQKYQEKNYQILQDWLDKNGKKPKE
ncbi:MAG: hypothetical protein LBP53_07045 [Candidatus Peribacteria bacterium]|nr:hypothetical protein [Candidatus Peribacteria bacterium]